MSALKKFEIHYFLPDNMHSMDAVVKNKCEAEFLAIAYEVIRLLELDITLNTEALKEGGLRDIWECMGKNAPQLTLLISVLTLVLTWMALPDSELKGLQKENLMLQNEQLKKQLAVDQISPEVVVEHAKRANDNQKIVTRRSNFYQALNISQEVTQVGFSALDTEQKPVGNEIIIPKSKFVLFIQKTNKLPTEIDENAYIEIVAPVLRKSKAKWRGVYNGQLIDFYMKDAVYKAAVLDKRISFTSGNAIICVLEMHRELNEVGDVIITKYCVLAVLDRIENNVPVETESGNKYRKEKKFKDSQMNLFTLSEQTEK